MTELRFFFNCFALCSMTPPDPEYPVDRDNQPSAELIGGFFHTRDEAENHIALHERRLILEHEQWCRKYSFRRGTKYKAGHYEIVPLASVRFSSLDDLEQAIRAAAVLQFSGVGVEVSA